MKAQIHNPNDTKEVFMECGTCSRTFAHLLNREFGYPKGPEEKAMNIMAGGIMNQGYQCGMLWGAALAVGAESYRKHGDLEMAVVAAMAATQYVLRSFLERTETPNCRDIIGFDLSSRTGMEQFMEKVNSQGMMNSHCFNLAEQWAPEAIKAALKGLGEEISEAQYPLSCASEVVRMMGGSDEEIAMVAGFAGGLGLSGGACGALSAALWKKMLDWCRENPEEDLPYFNNQTAEKILKAFRAETKGKMRCSEICGRNFLDLKDHTEYLNQGGCKHLLETLAAHRGDRI